MTLYRITKSIEEGWPVYKVWQRPDSFTVWVCYGDEFLTLSEAEERMKFLKTPFKEPEYEILYEDKE